MTQTITQTITQTMTQTMTQTRAHCLYLSVVPRPCKGAVMGSCPDQSRLIIDILIPLLLT